MCQLFFLKLSCSSFLLHMFILVRISGRKWKTLKLEAKTQSDCLEIESVVFFKKKKNGRENHESMESAFVIIFHSILIAIIFSNLNRSSHESKTALSELLDNYERTHVFVL